MDPITATALIAGGTSLLGSIGRRKAAKAQAHVAQQQLAQERLFKKLALKYGWAGRAAQTQALQQAPKMPAPGPSRTGSTIEAVGGVADSVLQAIEADRNYKLKQDYYKKLLAQQGGE